METAVAAAEAIDPALTLRLSEVRPLGEWVPRPGVSLGPNRTSRAREDRA
jgi:hypothetical protein